MRLYSFSAIAASSNWHAGRTLSGGKRYEEFKSYLSWLPEGIQKEQVDNMIKEKHEIHSRR